MTIYFLRHASAGNKKKDAVQDEKRSLDKTGLQQCSDVGRTLFSLEVKVDSIISSPLTRAHQTASLIAKEIGHSSKIEVEDSLRPQASYSDFRRMLKKHGKKATLMVVGHNPNFSEFLSLLITDSSSAGAIEMKKGAVAKVDIEGKEPAQLAWYITPKIARTFQLTTAASSRPKTVRK